MGQPLEIPMDVKLMSWVANTLLVVAVVLGLGGLTVWVARQSMWVLGGVTVEGDVTHQNAVAFRARLASRLSGSFITLDLQEVRRVLEGLPWVRRAVVQREFPNRLRVTLEEHQAVAWWGDVGDGKLVNRQGEVFEANPDAPDADRWPQLVGPDGHSIRVYEVYQELRPIFQRIELTLQRLELNARGSWKAELDNGAVIELGRGEVGDLLERARLFAATVSQLTQRYGRDLETVDLRYPNGYAVRLRGVTTVSNEKSGAMATQK